MYQSRPDWLFPSMVNTLICRLARRLALMAALAATTVVFISSTTAARVLLDTRTVAVVCRG